MAEQFIPPWAKKYEAAYATAARQRGAQAAKLLAARLPRQRRLTWLDGASGTGKFIASFLQPVLPLVERDAPIRNLITADLNAAALAWNCLEKEWTGPTLSLVADLRQLQLTDRSVDLMTLTNALEHMTATERHQVLIEAKRLLADDGVLYVAGPIKSPWSTIEYLFLKALHRIPKESRDSSGDADHEIWFSRTMLLNELRLAGWQLKGEDYYIYGSVKPLWRIKLGSLLQSFMPFTLRKLLAHGAMLVLQKSSEIYGNRDR